MNTIQQAHILLVDDNTDLLRLLEAHRPGDGRLAQLIEQVPPHCAAAVAELATHCGRTWLALADRLRERLRSST